MSSPRLSHDDWSLAVGRFILNFGTLEYLVNIYLSKHLDQEEFSKARERVLKDRLSKLEAVSQHWAASGQDGRFRQLLVRLDAIRGVRNQIAHGHLILRLPESPHASEILLSLPKNVDREYEATTIHVRYEEIQQGLSELTELIEAVETLAGFKESQNVSADSTSVFSHTSFRHIGQFAGSSRM